MLKVWGRKNSINVQKVLWCCDELQLEYERIDAGGAFGLTREPEYLAINPNGLVPTISDGGFVLWESNAIVRYLTAKYGAGMLYPEDIRQRADADRWMDWQMSTLWTAMRPVFWGLVRTAPEDRDEDQIESCRRRAAEAWSIVDARLSDRPYVSGDLFTMADIPLGVSVYRWYALDIERPSLPNVEAWYARLRERPAFQENVMLPLT